MAAIRVLTRIRDLDDFTGSLTDAYFLKYDSGSGTFSLQPLPSDGTGPYLVLAGVAGGQTAYGDTASGGNLTLGSTFHATKGKVLLGASSAYDEANVRLGVGTTSPTSTVTISQAQPASVSSATGTAGVDFVSTAVGTGGNTTIATTGTGGVGSAFTFTAGTGGQATAATTASTGGVGGAWTTTAGTGGAATVSGSGTNTGGVGGGITLTAGTGGAANSGATNNAGAGGVVIIDGGAGGVGTTTSGNGGAVFLRGGGAAAAAGSNGGGINISGRGGSSTGSGGGGGTVAITGGAAGGDDTVNRGGGSVTLTAGASKGSSAGGLITLTSGLGGAGTGATAGNGGSITFNPGNGGNSPSTGSATGGVGGGLNYTGGTGGTASNATVNSTGGLGGDLLFTSGTGGAATAAGSGTNSGGAGGVVQFVGGTGGAASNGGTSNAGGLGGNVSLTGGTGGVGTTTSGSGGTATLSGGFAAAGAGSAGGQAQVLGRAGSSTGSGGAGGAVTITAGNAGGDNTVNRAGGGVTVAAGNSKGSSAGGAISLTGGTGGAGTGTAGAAGGAITIQGGTGGVGSSTGGAGGALSLNGGSAPAIAGSSPGNASLVGGTCSSTGSGGPGGTVLITGSNAGGDGTVNRSGGFVTITAGNSIAGQAGGQVTVDAGAGGITGIGGLIRLRCGNGGNNTATGSVTGNFGGTIDLLGGAGGTVANATTAATGGTGGNANLTGGAGAAASASTSGANLGGTGGGAVVSGGSGGNATNGATNTGGAGGQVVISSGSGGTGATANGAAGNVTIQTGGTNRLQILGSTGAAIYTGGSGGSSTAFRVNTGADSNVGISIFGNSGTQSGNLLTLNQSGTTAVMTVTPAGLATVRALDSGTTSVLFGLTLGRNTTGTASNFIGSGLKFQAQTSTTADTDCAAILARWPTATHASRLSSLAFNLYDLNGSRTALFASTDGTGTQMALCGGTALASTSVYLNVPTASTVGFTIRQNAAPGSFFTTQDSGGNTLTYVASDGSVSTTIRDSQTANPSTNLVLDHVSSGTPGAGFGVDVSLKSSSDTTAARQQGNIRTTWATATDASRAARMTFFVSDATTAREGLRIESDGTYALSAFGGAVTAATRLTINTGADANSGLVITGNSSTQSANLLRINQSGTTALLTFSPGGLLTQTVRDALTNTTAQGLTIDHNTSGTPAAGFGTDIFVQAKSDTTITCNQGIIRFSWVDATHATRKARVTHLACDATSNREAFRIESNGSAGMIGFLGAAAVARQTISGSRANTEQALKDLLTALATLGLITDSTTT